MGRGKSGVGGAGNDGYVGDADVGLDNLSKLKPFYRRNSKNYKSAPYLMRTPLRTDGHVAEANSLNFSIQGADRDGGRITTVSVDSLRSTQLWVDSRGVRSILEGGSGHDFSSDVPVAVQVSGETWIVDGNHRAAAAKLSGKDRIRVRVIG